MQRGHRKVSFLIVSRGTCENVFGAGRSRYAKTFSAPSRKKFKKGVDTAPNT